MRRRILLTAVIELLNTITHVLYELQDNARERQPSHE